MGEMMNTCRNNSAENEQKHEITKEENKEPIIANETIETSNQRTDHFNSNIDNTNELFNSQKENNAILYSNYSLNHSIATVNIKRIKKEFEGEFIFIIDISQSMKEYIHQILNDIMPKVFENLNIDDKKIIHLLTFSNETTHYKLTKKEFEGIKIDKGESTQMLGVIKILEKLINSFNKETFINILVLTDGMIHDKNDTEEKLKNYINEVKNKYKYINSKAIRFISNDDAMPDTKVLCSFLRFDTDINFKLPITFHPIKNEKNSFENNENNENNELMNNEEIDDYVEQITKLFENQKSGYKIEGDGISLDPSSPLGKNYNSFELPFGKSIIFIHKSLNDETLNEYSIINKNNNKKINIENKGKVTQENLYNVYKEFFEKKIEEVLNNKVVGTNEAINKNEELIDFIEKIENETEGDRNYNKDVSIVNLLKQINKNTEIKIMDGDEINNYLIKKKEEIVNYVEKLVQDNKIEIGDEKIDLFLILDNSKYMKEKINILLNKVIYQVVKNKYKDDDKVKINILTFNSEDKNPQKETCYIESLENYQISCEGERHFYYCLKYLIKKIEKKDLNFHLFFFFSGNIEDKNNVVKLQFNLVNLINNRNIISRVVKYIINKDEDFEKNLKDKDLYKALTMKNSEILCNNIILKSYESNEEQIKILEDLFF